MECRIAIDEYLQEIEEKQQMQTACPVNSMTESVRTGIEYACGKTVYCRDGLLQLKQIIIDISNGKGLIEDLMTLEDICKMLKTGSQCLLAETIADQVMRSMEDNRGEWEKHCSQKLCSSMTCKGCYSLYIDPSVCNGCGECKSRVSDDAILGAAGMIHIIKNDSGLKEMAIKEVCSYGAIKKAGILKPQVPQSLIPVGTFKPAAGLLKKRKRNLGS